MLTLAARSIHSSVFSHESVKSRDIAVHGRAEPPCFAAKARAVQSTLRHNMADHAIRLRPPPTEDSSNPAWVMTRKRLSVDRSASYVDRRLVYCPEDELPGFIGSDPTAPGRRDRGYFGTPLLRHVAARFPWLFALMLVQSGMTLLQAMEKKREADKSDEAAALGAHAAAEAG